MFCASFSPLFHRARALEVSGVLAGESPSRAWDEEMEVEEISRREEEECSLPL